MATKNSDALNYHALPKPGKLAIEITKPMHADDLKLAYTPGVAEPVLAIAKNPKDAYLYTSKGNLVGVISNGSAILGLGNLGPLASKPVMEGKAILFKHLADIDAFDIEIDAKTPEEVIDTVKRIAPTFGGINLEDIKAPDCFIIEKALQAQLDIPVFHDDQHGTAIVLAAGLLNALKIQNKSLETVKIVCLGSGAAGIACMQFLHELGADKNNILVIDRGGVLHAGRTGLNPYKQAWVHPTTTAKTLADAMKNADVFIGLAGPNLVNEAMLQSMNDKPILFALSNPDPEISPEQAKKACTHCIIATGRSDYPNQVNNVLCFPYIFRGTFDAGAKQISFAMKHAATQAIAQLAIDAPLGQTFGKDYIIPHPTDPRLKEQVSNAVRNAALNEQNKIDTTK